METIEQMMHRADTMLRGFNGYVGIRPVSCTAEHFEIEAELKDELYNSEGIAHGGFLFTLCDAACGFLARADGRPTVTQSANIYYLRPGRGRKLRAVSRIIRSGRRTGVYEARVYDEEDKLVSEATCSMFFLETSSSDAPGK